MTKFSIIYEKNAKKDCKKISKDVLKNIKDNIEKKLKSDPILFSSNLKGNLKTFRKFRVGNYRVIFKLENNLIKIYTIGTRSNIYDQNNID